MDNAEYFCERPYIPVVYSFSKGYDVNGPRWRSLRRFTVDFLRKYGMGKKVMEMRILEESKYLVRAVAESGGKVFNPTMALSCAVGNTMGGMMFGLHFDYKDKQLHDLLFSITKHIRGFVSPLSTVCNSLPILLNIPYIRKKVFQNTEYILRFVAESVKHHKENLNPESPKDFIDYFLLKIKEVENEVDPDFCDTSLPAMVLTTLAAGTETTAASLKFIVVLLAHYPEVQAKVQQEIDEATKNLRQPEIADRPQMPYTYAVIHEIQRVLDIAPTALFHAVNQEVKFRGYTIPKGTTVIPFLTSVLMDPSQWETPEEFNPRHFLTEDGQFRNQLAFMVYSAGKRVCPAENMARMELFLFISALLQKFTFILPPGTKRQDAKFLNLHKTEILLYAEILAEPRMLSK
ncbi:cytochrome P450 2C29-like [Bufo gargarizans]|uniref:cytochrome P450 2C29-like n=1 Tax=Bufo gargarizans TaxID=30331 RepID=UPI001CF52055|nr:cytochrome P450 2C29-like [Bufo gargarizans]